MARQETVLLTGGRGPAALDLARQLKAHQYRVFAAESQSINFCRFSNAVAQHAVIPHPVKDEAGFLEGLEHILKTQTIDYLIPAYDEVYFVAKYKSIFEKYTRVLCSDWNLIDQLNNKRKFTTWVKSLGIPVPETQHVKNLAAYQQLSAQGRLAPIHMLKPIYTAGGVGIRKITSDQIASVSAADFPCLVQTYVEGQSMSTFSIAHEGRLTCHVAYKPVYIYREQGAGICFEAQPQPILREYVEAIVKACQFTGMLGFDFIVEPSGAAYVLECNPRITNGVHLFSLQDNLPEHLLKPQFQRVHEIKSGPTRQITRAAMLNILGKTVKNDFSKWFDYFWKSEEIIFQWHDPAPICMLPLLGIYYAYLSLAKGKTAEESIFYNVDWGDN